MRILFQLDYECIFTSMCEYAYVEKSTRTCAGCPAEKVALPKGTHRSHLRQIHRDTLKVKVTHAQWA